VTVDAVAVEERALAAALASASPDIILAQANAATDATLADLERDGHLSADNPERARLRGEILNAAIAELGRHAANTVAFHRRALAIAKQMHGRRSPSGGPASQRSAATRSRKLFRQ
jgi:hypothetical protein